ncbi:hypothetical protein ALC57_15843 [Trachymyrmex cornetzi]|uniref:Uncharacterized protein n=1 Tax=Trachymyrmex cornetzi TaxID=471704 RepID=A0A151IVX0_9HYME|nr:hypothetical protein ALC57_15843 [Trachymyrmex cornetzi]
MHVESGQPWSCGGKEKKDGKKECRWFTVIKYRRTRACVAPKLCDVQAAKPCAKRSLFYGRSKKKKNRRRRTRDNGERRKSYLHQDSAQFSNYHTANGKSCIVGITRGDERTERHLDDLGNGGSR